MRQQGRPENLSHSMAALRAGNQSGLQTVYRSYQEFTIILQERVAYGTPLPLGDAS